jgi:sugar/nucleoside kinase (ribokinase family)
MNQNPELVVVGSVAIDDVRTPTGAVEGVLGGATVYFALASQFFARTGMVGVVGDDYPEEAVDLFREKGINVEGLERKSGKTFHWSGLYHDDINERSSLATDLNVFEDFQPELPESYRSAQQLFLANILPTLQLDVLNQVESPRIVGMDTMDFWIQGEREDLEEVLAGVDAVLINDSEARMLADCTGTLRAAHRIAEMGPDYVVVKRGEFGAFLYAEEQFFFVPAYPVEDVVDPTGAGDCFAGGMFGFLSHVEELNLESLRQALVAGSVMASFCIEDFSIERLKSLTLREIQQRARGFENITRFEPIDDALGALTTG